MVVSGLLVAGFAVACLQEGKAYARTTAIRREKEPGVFRAFIIA
jgi:hypothetical protein